MQYKYPKFYTASDKVAKCLKSCKTAEQCESVRTMVKNLYSAYPQFEEVIDELLIIVNRYFKFIFKYNNKPTKTPISIWNTSTRHSARPQER